MRAKNRSALCKYERWRRFSGHGGCVQRLQLFFGVPQHTATNLLRIKPHILEWLSVEELSNIYRQKNSALREKLFARHENKDLTKGTNFCGAARMSKWKPSQVDCYNRIKDTQRFTTKTSLRIFTACKQTINDLLRYRLRLISSKCFDVRSCDTVLDETMTRQFHLPAVEL